MKQSTTFVFSGKTKWDVGLRSRKWKLKCARSVGTQTSRKAAPCAATWKENQKASETCS